LSELADGGNDFFVVYVAPDFAELGTLNKLHQNMPRSSSVVQVGRVSVYLGNRQHKGTHVLIVATSLAMA